MSKEGSANYSKRSSERQALAEAIHLRDEVAARTVALAKGKERAAQDRRKANRDVEDAKQALTLAREAARAALVDAYVDGEGGDDAAARMPIAEAEAALDRAQRRVAEIQAIVDQLNAPQEPGHSVPHLQINEAVRAVVRADPVVRRLVQDFDLAKRTFQTAEATLVFLAGQKCIPDDLVAVAPRKDATRYADPDPTWIKAIEALKRDPDATLPE